MIEFFSPNSRALLPTFRTDCPEGSHFAQNTTPNPCCLLSRHTPLSGYVHTQNAPNPTPKHPFSWPELESGQNETELQSGQPRPQRGKMFENWTKPF